MHFEGDTVELDVWIVEFEDLPSRSGLLAFQWLPRTVPFYHYTHDLMGLEKIKDDWGSIVRALSGDGRIDSSSNNNRAESIPPVLAKGGETSCLDRVTNAAFLR